ncbi:nidogen-1-like isoform X2 [Anneissia japonica]|uniref:nidogen-1-like isoform X2 n=1 Tax=Anneissia japonica TaxID=1529436 RepID=UPI001425A092|nr:nidogen-1-like isoform X2 [Anneissia japonica]
MGYLGQLLLLVGLAASTLSLRRQDFYRYGSSVGQKALRSGDAQQANLNSRVPVILDNAQLTAVFVHTDGFLKFEHTPTGEQPIDFSTDLSDFRTKLIAPFLTDLDTSSDNGYIWYGSSTDTDYLRKARNDVYRYLSKDFTPQSVLIFTWEDVLQKGTSATVTFQLVIATDGLSTYAMFQYENPIQVPSGTTSFPQAGVTLGDGSSYILLPGSGLSSVFDLDIESNVGLPGLFLYDLRAFGTSQPDSGNEPDGSGETVPTETDPFISTTASTDTSNRDVVEDDCSQCNGECKKYSDGFCCVCNAGYTGNGVSCLQEGSDIRVSGLVSGNINGKTFSDLDLHTFVVLGEGRAYVAVSPLDEDLGLTMQLLSTIGEFMGWMFSVSTDKALNGFQLTGGKLYREAYVSVDGGYFVRITQDFLGFDEQGQLHVDTNIDGTLPVISITAGSITYGEHEEVFERKEPGRIRSVSSRNIEFTDFTIRYSIDQTISFQECTADERDRPAGQDSMSLTILQQYTSFDSSNDGGILRFATSSRIALSDQTVVDPCAENDCSGDATCVPQGTSFFCECNEGFEGDGRNCRVVDICANVNCGTDAYCSVFANRHECVCLRQGYIFDGFNCRGPCEFYNCPSNAYCEEDSSGNAQCICLENYRKDGDFCVVVDACEGFICLDHNARCQLDQENLATCVCNHGYTFIGDKCEIQEATDGCASIVCQSNAHCETKNEFDSACYCNDGFISNGVECVEIPPEDPCHGNQCDQYAGQCIPGIGQLYSCVCLDGFDGNGYICTDIDECSLRRDDCHPRAKCENYQGSYNCICLPGFEGDGRSCTATQTGGGGDGVLIFAQGNSIMSLPLNGDAGRKVFMNSRQTMIGVGYDCKDDLIYWTDISTKTISSVRSDGTGSKVIIRKGLLSPEGVAVDWISRNMYWTDSGYHRIEVSSLDGSYRRVLVNTNLKYPRAVVVDPVGGNLYWTDWTRSNPKIETSALDGSDRKVLVNKNIKLPNGLTIDYNSQQICWADAVFFSGTSKVECMNLDGDANSRFTVTSEATYPFSLTVHSNIFYWTDWQSRRIENIDKNGNSLGTPLQSPPGGSGRLYGIVAASSCPAGTNACAYNNGDCSALCLPTPDGKTCACGHTTDGNEIPCEDAP